MDNLVSASILSADLLHLEQELQRLKAAGADMLHFDVMDGHFVPNLSFGLPLLQAVSGASSLMMDVHLMISNPGNYIVNYASSGADLITFHLECDHRADRVIEAIHDAGCQAGLSIKPGTPAAALEPYLDKLEYVLVMTVEPGFGGQSYIPEMTQKIADVRRMIGSRNIRLEVDGGINAETALTAVRAGADVLVAGSYLFGCSDMHSAVKGLKRSGREGDIQ